MLTQCQIRHIQLAKLQLLRITDHRPAEIVGDTGARGDSSLDCVYEQMDRYSRIICAEQVSLKTQGPSVLISLTAQQRPNCPDTQWRVIQQLHPHIHGEPCRRIDEELVLIGVDVELAQIDHKLRAEGRWIKRVQINTCDGSSVCSCQCEYSYATKCAMGRKN